MFGRRRLGRVLVVDDDPLLCELVRETLGQDGIAVDAAHHVIEAEKSLAESLPDAIVLDLGLPGVDGVFYCERLRESARTRAVPIVAISGSQEAGARARGAGADAFLHKPLDPLLLLAALREVTGSPAGTGRDRLSRHDELGRLLQIGQRQHDLLLDAYRETLEALADALESRDLGTSAHSRRVAGYATMLTLEVEPGLVDDPTLEWGFVLHDVGKIGVPDRVLLKRGALTRAERRHIEQHTLIGERLVGHIPLLHGNGIKVVRSHHERWDGDGYPDRTAGTKTPVAARIFAAADALDAMTVGRPYRAAISWDEAITTLVDARGSQFDPDVIDAVDACEPALRRTYAQMQPIAV